MLFAFFSILVYVCSFSISILLLIFWLLWLCIIGLWLGFINSVGDYGWDCAMLSRLPVRHFGSSWVRCLLRSPGILGFHLIAFIGLSILSGHLFTLSSDLLFDIVRKPHAQ